MKLIKFVAYILYDYYSTGSRAMIKYDATLGVMTLFAFMNLFAFSIVLNLDYLLPHHSDKSIGYIKMFSILLPIYLLLRLLIKEKELESAQYTTETIIAGRIWVFGYFILSTAALAFIIYSKK